MLFLRRNINLDIRKYELKMTIEATKELHLLRITQIRSIVNNYIVCCRKVMPPGKKKQGNTNIQGGV